MNTISWDQAKPGDRFNGHIVIARKLRPKRRARVLADCVNAEVWIDTSRSWAVMLQKGGGVILI